MCNNPKKEFVVEDKYLDVVEDILTSFPELLDEDISRSTVNYLLQGVPGGLDHEISADLLMNMLAELGYVSEDLAGICSISNELHTFYGLNLVGAIQAGVCVDPELYPVYKLVETLPLAEVSLRLGDFEDAVSHVFGVGLDGGVIDFEDKLDPLYFVDDFDKLLQASRTYRTASSATRDECSKFCQKKGFGDDYVGFKFDIPVDGDVVFLGSGDENGTSHLPLVLQGHKVRCVDPRNPSVYAEHPKHHFASLAACGCRADLCYEEKYIFSDMSNPNADMSGVGSLKRFRRYYEEFYRQGKKIAFKWDITEELGFPVRFWKKPRRHNKEVILVANFGELGAEYDPYALIVEAIKANWERNRKIYWGEFDIPEIKYDVIERLKVFGELIMDPRPVLRTKHDQRVRFPIPQKQWHARLDQPNKYVRYYGVNHYVLLFFYKLCKRGPLGVHFDLRDFKELDVAQNVDELFSSFYYLVKELGGSITEGVIHIEPGEITMDKLVTLAKRKERKW